MAPIDLLAARGARGRTLSDGFADDVLIEIANLDQPDTNVPGTIFVSTALGSHGPRVTWYPARAGKDLPCLIISIESDPTVRDTWLPPRVSAAAEPLVTAWVRLNHDALLRLRTDGTSWNRREVSAFRDALKPLP